MPTKSMPLQFIKLGMVLSIVYNGSVIISDESIKNNVVISILHIYSHSNGIKKTIHHAINITHYIN